MREEYRNKGPLVWTYENFSLVLGMIASKPRKPKLFRLNNSTDLFAVRFYVWTKGQYERFGVYVPVVWASPLAPQRFERHFWPGAYVSVQGHLETSVIQDGDEEKVWTHIKARKVVPLPLSAKFLRRGYQIVEESHYLELLDFARQHGHTFDVPKEVADEAIPEDLPELSLSDEDAVSVHAALQLEGLNLSIDGHEAAGANEQGPFSQRGSEELDEGSS